MDERLISKLEADIRYHNHKYYDEDSPVLSDVLYDEMINQLKKLAPDSPVLNEIGNPTFGLKYKHKSKMGSLQKCHTFQEIADKFGDQLVGMSPKVDGISLSLHYNQGGLQMAVTRGDGETGEIVTPNVCQLLGVPLRIDYTYPVEVRGEGYIAKKDFYGIMDVPGYGGHEKGFANPRNAAAGSIRQKDPLVTKSRNVSFVGYRVIGVDTISQYEQEMYWLEAQGFPFFPYWLTSMKDKEESLIETIHNYDVPYEIDGIVIMLNSLADFKKAGWAGKCPKGAIAYKFETEKKKAVIKDIIWQTGRTGKVTPVAIIDATEICGSTIRRITLHNYAWLMEHDYAIGDTVLFEKANEIIPEIVEALDRPVDRQKSLITVCPSCSFTLERSITGLEEQGADIVCHNSECSAQFSQKVEYMLKTIGVKGIARTTIEKMDLDHPWSIFDMNEEEFQKLGFGEIESTTMVQSLANVKTTPERLLASLGIQGWAESMFAKLFKNSQIAGQDWLAAFVSNNYFPEDMEACLTGIRGLQLMSGMNNCKVWLQALNFRVIVESASIGGVLAGSTFCVTGKLSKGRGEIASIIKDNGGIVKDSITKSLDYLIAGEKAGSKLTKAADAGVVVLSEIEFNAMIEDGKEKEKEN